MGLHFRLRLSSKAGVCGRNTENLHTLNQALEIVLTKKKRREKEGLEMVIWM